MNEFLTNLNTYSNLLLVIITSIYVFLTWRMVSEMRRAREAESEPQLVANLIPLGAMSLKLRISNAGRGPALNIKAAIRLVSKTDNSEETWSHPVLLSNGHEDFRLPGDSNNNYLDKLASKYEKLVVDLEWHNSFRRRQNSKFVIDLRQQLVFD